MAKDLILYSGPECHLCELAEQVISQLPDGLLGEIVKVDISKDHDAYHLYALRIPVVKRTDNQQELGWPFDVIQLEGFLS